MDVGTNSVRLLVVDGAGRRITRQMRITRLGRGVDETGRFDEDSLRATLDALGDYREIWESHGVDQVRIAATSAVRDADDRDRFFAGVREVTGTGAEVLSGVDEARTTYLGVTRSLDVHGPLLVLDVGGGSTEIVVGDGEQDPVAVSMQLGCVRLTEQCLRSDPPDEEEVDQARRRIDRRLDEGLAQLRQRGGVPRRSTTAVGVAGTVTTLAALHLGLETYEEDAIHATAIPTGEIANLTQRLLAMPAASRAELGPMSPGREDVIAGGAMIVHAVLQRFGFPRIIASEADILDGLAASWDATADE